MFSWAVLTVFTAGGLLLLAAGVGHVLRRRHLEAVLVTHHLPARARRLIASGLGFTEVVVGAAMVATAATGAPGVIGGVLGALVYGAFAVYLVRVLRVAPGADCGCFGADEPATAWTVARAGLLAVACVLTAVVRSPVATAAQGGILLAAGVVVALVLTVVTAVASMASHPAAAGGPR